MNMLKKAAIAMTLALPLSVWAQTATPRIDQRQDNQEARIQQGVQSGSLTQQEAGRLERGQNHVDRMENRAKSDGVVDNRERMRIQNAENRQSREIRREKHDRQHDFNHDGRNDRRHEARREARREGNLGGHRERLHRHQ